MLRFGFSQNHIVIGSYNTDAQYQSYALEDPNVPKYDMDSPSSKEASAQFKNTITAAKATLAAKNPMKKSADFLYVRTRAIGSLEKWGPNMNGDGFPMGELAKSYSTFVGKGNFIDHKSDDITKIRGLVIDAYLNKDDQCVECLIAVDKKSHPQLARDIDTGTVNSVSMGTRVGWSLCSVCQNKARTEKDYCSHISNYKGMKISFLTNNPSHRNGGWPVHEVNHDLEFIELSWVAVPAFGDAHVLEKVASVKGAKSVEDYKADFEIRRAALIEESKKEISKDEKDLLDLFVTEQADRSASVDIPEALQGIANLAQCMDETECANDPRRAVSAPNNENIKTANEMRRINITNDQTIYRRTPNDFFGKGTVNLDGKEYKWWASSSDKAAWNVNIDEDLAEILSAKGQAQIIDAVEQLTTGNKPSTELIVASAKGNTKTAYVQNGDDPEYMNKKIKDLEETVASEKFPNIRIYNPKDLEAPQGDVREGEQKAFEETAKEGPSGALGKPLPKKDETLDSEELNLKKKMRRAYVEYLSSKKAN